MITALHNLHCIYYDTYYAMYVNKGRSLNV